MDGDDVVKTTRKPPTMKQLLEDPLYRKMMVTPPKPAAFNWSVFAVKTENRWTGKVVAGYGEAFNLAKVLLTHPDFVDVSIVSRARFFAPPVKFMWETHAFDWCARCRRPSTFNKRQGLHALRNAPVLTTDEPYRCYFCGIRKVAMPNYQPIMYTPEELAAIAKAEEEEVNGNVSTSRRRKRT